MSVGLIILLAVLSTLRITALRDGYADDNCWILLIHETDGLQGFLEKSFSLMHREGVGTLFYFLLSNFEQPWFPWLWHGINLLTEIGSPVLLYLVVNRYLNHQALATLSAVMLIALHGDHTLGYISGINYRLGLLFALLSFWLMERWYWTAVGCAAFSVWGCTETALALEPVRLLLITPRLMLPFLLVTGSLVIYRVYIPTSGLWGEGLWTGVYLPPQSFYEVIRLILLWPYKEAQDVWGAIWIAEPWTWLYGIVAGGCAWVLAKFVQELEA